MPEESRPQVRTGRGPESTMRSTRNADAVRPDLLDCAGRLTEDRALLVTARFHDHSRLLRRLTRRLRDLTPTAARSWIRSLPGPPSG